MKAKIITSLLVVAVITLSFSFISVNKVAKEKKNVTIETLNSGNAPIGGLASSDKLD